MAFAPDSGYMAAGTMAGAIDQSFDSSASLEILKLDFASSEQVIPDLGSCATTERFNRLSWSSNELGGEEYPYGVIAGGLVDGTVNLFNPALLLRWSSSLCDWFRSKSSHVFHSFFHIRDYVKGVSVLS